MARPLGLLSALLLASGFVLAQEPAAPSARERSPGLIVPEAAKPGPAFDVDKATDA